MKTCFMLFLAMCISATLFAQKKLQVGATAPDFKAFNHKGKSVSLYDELKDGPVVLVFYRGNWSNECMDFLMAIQDSMDVIKEKRATVIAVTPESAKGIEKTLTKSKAKFSLVSDMNAEIMKLYDVEHKADPHLVNQLKTKGVDLKALNETNATYLPVPAVFVIGKNKKVNYVFFEADYTKRPSISDFVATLDAVVGGGFKKK